MPIPATLRRSMRGSDGTDGIIYFPTSGCESDTALYLYLWWDNGIKGVQTDKQYSYMDGFGYAGDFGPNYYDEVLAHYALYYRSGWTPARDAARKLGDNWLEYPEIANGDAGGIPRRMSITGGVCEHGFGWTDEELECACGRWPIAELPRSRKIATRMSGRTPTNCLG